jgi:ABC-2 type transport system ATP-binding protein
MLRAEGVTKSYGEVQALRGMDLSVDAGQIVALLGRNGAGKSTLLSIIAGLLDPDAGSVRVDDIDVLADQAAGAQRIGIAPQDTGIYRVLTVRENLEFFGEIAGLDRQERKERADFVAEHLGLAGLMDRRGTQLSGGEARRLHTACALVHTPPLLLLDEPTVGADVATRNHLIEAVRSLAANGAAVVYTTHYLPEVEALGAEIVIIDEGRALARGTRNQLMAANREVGLDVETRPGAELNAIESLGAFNVRPLGSDRWRIVGEIDVAGLVDRLGPRTDDIVAIESIQPDLEQVFLTVTGSALDDDVVGSPIEPES